MISFFGNISGNADYCRQTSPAKSTYLTASLSLAQHTPGSITSPASQASRAHSQQSSATPPSPLPHCTPLPPSRALKSQRSRPAAPCFARLPHAAELLARFASVVAVMQVEALLASSEQQQGGGGAGRDVHIFTGRGMRAMNGFMKGNSVIEKKWSSEQKK